MRTCSINSDSVVPARTVCRSGSPLFCVVPYFSLASFSNLADISGLLNGDLDSELSPYT